MYVYTVTCSLLAQTYYGKGCYNEKTKKNVGRELRRICMQYKNKALLGCDVCMYVSVVKVLCVHEFNLIYTVLDGICMCFKTITGKLNMYSEKEHSSQNKQDKYDVLECKQEMTKN